MWTVVDHPVPAQTSSDWSQPVQLSCTTTETSRFCGKGVTGTPAIPRNVVLSELERSNLDRANATVTRHVAMLNAISYQDPLSACIKLQCTLVPLLRGATIRCEGSNEAGDKWEASTSCVSMTLLRRATQSCLLNESLILTTIRTLKLLSKVPARSLCM